MSIALQYSYCEFTTAGSRSRWCIRRLSEKGPKYGGGIDTPSLCGRSHMGWDINVLIDDINLDGACPTCAKLYREAHASARTQ